MGRKLKVYLDTSAISHLIQEEVPEKMVDKRNYGNCFKIDEARLQGAR